MLSELFCSDLASPVLFWSPSKDQCYGIEAVSEARPSLAGRTLPARLQEPSIVVWVLGREFLLLQHLSPKKYDPRSDGLSEPGIA